MLKKIRNLPISSIMTTTYTRYNKFFIDKGRQVEMVVRHVYSKVVAKVLKDAPSMFVFVRRSTRFLVKK